MHLDTLIHGRWVIPVEPGTDILEHHAVGISGGRISAILPSAQADEQLTAEQTIRLDHHAILPGLINAHTHAAMSLFRGLADDLPLMTWLNEHIWPAEAKWVHEEFVADGTRHAVAEMIRSGTTCFNDMYFFPDITAHVAAQSGIRATVGLITIDFPTVWAETADEYLGKALQVHDQFRGHPLIKTAFAPHAPYSVSDEPLKRIRTLADELELSVHMHVHETDDEIEQSLEKHGVRPIERLKNLGLMSPELIAVHLTHVTEDEIESLATSGCHVVHCPESNLKLSSGFCPVNQLLEHGVNIALGTDGAASNNDLDMLGEMNAAALLGKGINKDPTALKAEEVLQMATIHGARALGLENEIGSIKEGKSADIIAIDLNRIETQPVFNPVSQIVYSAGREQVSDVWVAGDHLLNKGKLTRMDLDEILGKAHYWQEKISIYT